MKISVALCTFNGEKYIEKQLDSILNQSIKVNEIIVCDDQSTDTTILILEKYSLKHPGLFKIHKNETNLRSNKNFEKAISLCTGDYIFLSDQDDLWREDKVEKTLNVFSKNPTAEGVFSNATLINDKDQLLFKDISLWDSVCFFENQIPKPIDLFKLLILKGNYLTGATLCIKKEVKEFCFPFQTIEKTFLHDEWFAFILSQRKTLFYSTDKLISYRLHENQQMGVGNILKNAKKIKKSSKKIKVLLGIKKPTSFNDFKTLTRAYFSQYEKFKVLFKNNKNEHFDLTDRLLIQYKEADVMMKKKNPVLYFFRKLKDKRKGKRQL